MPTKKMITPGMIKAWDALDVLTLKLNRPPTINEIMDQTDLKTTSLIRTYFLRGVESGRVATLDTRGGRVSYVPVWYLEMIKSHIAGAYKAHRESLIKK